MAWDAWAKTFFDYAPDKIGEVAILCPCSGTRWGRYGKTTAIKEETIFSQKPNVGAGPAFQKLREIYLGENRDAKIFKRGSESLVVDPHFNATGTDIAVAIYLPEERPEIALGVIDKVERAVRRS